MENISRPGEEEEQMDLPPGFRFHPTDEELITHYLSPKVLDNYFCAKAIGEVDLNKCEPWDLPWRAKMGEKEWYFFCVRDKKYPTGLRTNRATDAGYWKATGKDREIYKAKTLVGMKKTLVFYKGRAPRGEKTNWVMHEYRLEGKYSIYNLPKTAKNEWVICRVFQKNSGGKKTNISGLVRLSTCGNEFQPSILPPLMDSPPHNSETGTNTGDTSHVTCFSNQGEDQKSQDDNIIDSYNPTSNPSDMSPASTLVSKPFIPNIFSSCYAQNNGSLYQTDSIFMQDQCILRMLLENDGPYMKRNSKTEFPHENTGLSTDISTTTSSHGLVQRSYEDQVHPSTSGGPVDLYCLWNY